MERYILLASLLLPSFLASASNLLDHELVKNERSCFSWVFSDYGSWRNQMKKKYEKSAKSEETVDKKLAWFDSMFTQEKYDLYKSSLDCSTFEYEVDSHMVKGYVIKPKGADKKLPVLVYNRGGNGNFGGVVFGSMMHNLFPIAQEGFVIVGSQYRGTHTKFDTLDEFGGEDVKDVTALLDLIPSISGADSNRVGMYGASRGGMQTHLALKHSNNIKAIATIAGNTDLAKGLTYRPEMEKVYKKRIPNYLENKQQELDRRSVLKWVDELSPNVPILLLHGTADKRVSVKHSEDFASELVKYNIPHKLVLYPNDNHGLFKNKEAVNNELVSWFGKHL
ncbi:alpha/beta hydrolase family protein [Alteromonas sp. PRIM-21]|uniref:alpha/beta hydrolase family protein n=1 Tax=Alteromonas sp. PRIM-21 TaxID=1454978 RepID=UPI0022B944D0|nr:prolyl oligopeptidase family serine peptidase [Alteromonas sp. PRIM-21]MCZ8529967.1 prolyl oligopeptidase family serine peptidase [Alteromonas sp. PRIM-21]